MTTHQGDLLTDYDTAGKEIKALIADTSSDQVLDAAVTYLYEAFEKYSWVGIYVIKDNVLVLNSWRGPQATKHTRIPVGRGICGAAAQSGRVERVSDVAQDERYLACFISTKSEIVVPIKKAGKVIGEIDIDSDVTNAFDDHDALFLERVATLLSEYIG